MDSIIVPAEKLPEHHALLDKVSQACAEIDTKLAMIHDVLQQENYIKRMIIIVSLVLSCEPLGPCGSLTRLVLLLSL